MKKSFFSVHALIMSAVLGFFTIIAGASYDPEDYLPENTTGIPSDELASDNPEVGENTTVIPNGQYTVTKEGESIVVKLDMTGIRDAVTYGWLKLYGTMESGQNIWLSIDGKPKAIVVYNNGEEDSDRKMMADLVFLVDNSGSMSEEANAVARDIIDWAKVLEASNLDISFGCVGYSVNGTINGGLNITNANELSNFLNRSNGTSRTMGFSGSDASTLQTAANAMTKVYDECGGMALRFADQNMNFRNGANRIYVNFTDEPNQPNNVAGYSTSFFMSQENWNSNQGTVHTVYSSDTTFTERPMYVEKPWRISEYTGGTTLKAPSNFNGVDLNSLPVTGAMVNSYIIRFTNVVEYLDGLSHDIKITIKSADGQTVSEKVFSVNFGLLEDLNL